MNTIATFRKCTLSDSELLEKIDKATDKMYKTGKIPDRNIPARPDSDYDLLVGELILRYSERVKNTSGDNVKFTGNDLRQCPDNPEKEKP